MKPENIDISQYDYDLPEGRIAKFPLCERDASKLLVWRNGAISQSVFSSLPNIIPPDALLIFNDTKVIRARLLMRKTTGALIEIFCLEPHFPADYERSLAARGQCQWRCIVGNSKKWKEGPLEMPFSHDGQNHILSAEKGVDHKAGQTVIFRWGGDLSFGQLLEILGRIPIPPYLGRDSHDSDNTRYQTVYSRFEGSVAAPTAGLHFSRPLLDRLASCGISSTEVTLHVGAGTFLPVKSDDATAHDMHTEHFTVTADTLRKLLASPGKRIAVGTTTVRTLESIAALCYRLVTSGNIDPETPVGQWEAYSIPENLTAENLLSSLLSYLDSRKLDNIRSSTKIMIAPGYRFRLTDGIITNFHQPRSTLLLLVSAFTGNDWSNIYTYALTNGFRFLSYGDSSILLK